MLRHDIVYQTDEAKRGASKQQEQSKRKQKREDENRKEKKRKQETDISKHISPHSRTKRREEHRTEWKQGMHTEARPQLGPGNGNHKMNAIELSKKKSGCRSQTSAPVCRSSYGGPQPGPENWKSIRELYWNCILKHRGPDLGFQLLSAGAPVGDHSPAPKIENP